MALEPQAPTMAETVGEADAVTTLEMSHDQLAEMYAQNGREVVRVGVHVRHVPTAIVHPCLCGRSIGTDDENMVKHARRPGAEFPPIECPCGRVVLASTSPVVLT
jgi:hypothetical protein